MSLNPNQQAVQLKRALAEVRANRDHFTAESFSQIVIVMLDKLRHVQTVAPEDHPLIDEIRLVTVMFIDVKDSTEIVQRIDASDWKRIIDTAHEKIAEVVSQWEGQIGQYLGDGVLCFFGAQRSRGDDAPHAVSCALQIQTLIERYATQVLAEYHIEFGVRIGISTGRVVVGMIGSQTIKQELLALGPATNLAARLQGEAPVGGVLVDGTTYNRIRRDYITQAQAPVNLRGFDAPVKNYRVLGRRTQPASQFTDTQIAGIELPLVGRDEDLALISYRCDRALQNQTCEVLTITGDIGMGKSRLLQETIHLTEGHFNHVIMTSQYEARTQSQNLLWDMLMAQCHLTDDMARADILQQVEAYVSHLWDHPDALKAAHALAYLAGFITEKPDGDLRELVLCWFEALALQMPIMIVVDNLQWADAESIQLLEHIAQRLHQTPTVIITAARPEYTAIYPTFMKGYTHHQIVELEALHPDATLGIIQSVFSKIDRIPSTLAYSINERVEGNPLFVYEYIGMLFDNDVFRLQSDGGWRFNIIMLDVALNTLPNGLLGILQARLDDLPDQARQVMQIAAISGQQFWESNLVTLTDMDNISSWIQHLITRGMVVEDDRSIFDGEHQYHFKHNLYRDVAYKMIPRVKRQDYHRQTALWLLERIAGATNSYPLLAEQFADSGNYLAALYTYLEAIEVQILKKQELKALKFIDKALSLANQVDRNEALAVVAKLWAYRGEALITLERYEEASAASQSSLMLLDELSDDQLVASRITAERILGLAYFSLGRYTDSYDALTRAHNLLPLNATAQIASVLQAFGQLYYRQGRLQDSIAYLRRALTMANKTQDLTLIASSLVLLSQVDIETGNLAEALAYLNDALQIYRSVGLAPEQAHTLSQIGVIHLTSLDYAKAYEYFSDADYLNTTFGQVNALVQAYRAYSLILLGRTTQGKGILLDAMNNSPRDVDMQHRLQVISISIAAFLQDYAQVRDQAFAFVQQEAVNPILKARTYLWLGLASHDLGTTDAISHLYKALEDEQAYAGRDGWLCYAILAQCLTDTAEKMYHYQLASQLIQERAITLEASPEIRDAFINSKFVKRVLKYAGSNNDLVVEE
ncbi:MAG: adenylate/guanylate cyclase domain-containing protein [Phototrophicaceae bacterium]